MCSTILNPDETMSTRSVEETINSTALESGLAAAVKSRTTVDWLNDLELAQVKKAGAFELFAETLARFPASSLAHRNATLARGQLRDALDRPEPPLNVREPWPMFGTHCVMS